MDHCGITVIQANSEFLPHIDPIDFSLSALSSSLSKYRLRIWHLPSTAWGSLSITARRRCRKINKSTVFRTCFHSCLYLIPIPHLLFHPVFLQIPPYRFALLHFLFPDTSCSCLLSSALVSQSSTRIRRLSSNPLHCLQSRKWLLPALLPYLKAVTRAGFSDSLSAPGDREHE